MSRRQKATESRNAQLAVVSCNPMLAGVRYGPDTSFTHQSRDMVYTFRSIGAQEVAANTLERDASGAAIASKRSGVLARYGRQAKPASQGASLD